MMTQRPIEELWLELTPDSELSREGRLELAHAVGTDMHVVKAFKAGRLSADEVPRILSAIKRRTDQQNAAWGYKL